MTQPIDPLEHVPDPDKRYQVMAIRRTPLVWVEIADRQAGTAFICDPLSALQLAADITNEVARIVGEVTEEALDTAVLLGQLSETDIERWQRDIWRKPQN